MVERLVVAAAMVASLTLVDEGKATRYDPVVMDVVIANRPKWKHITPEQVEQAAGFVALQGEHVGE